MRTSVTIPVRTVSAPLYVLGVDPGATTGLALIRLDNAGATWLGDESTRRDPGASSLMADHLELLDLVAIESVRSVYPRARFAAHMATCIARASRVAGEIAGAARAHGIEVVDVTAEEWRKALCSSRQATDAMVSTVIRSRVSDWPTRSNAHVRDAAGVALFAGRRALRIAGSRSPAQGAL